MNYSKLKLLKERIGSNCFIDVFDNKKELIFSNYNNACHGSKSLNLSVASDKILLYFEYDKSYFSDEDMQRWCEFCTLCGFPCLYEGVKEIELKGPYAKFKKEFIIVKLMYDDYVSSKHVGCGITSIRLLSYSLGKGMGLIPVKTFELKEALGDEITDLQALLIGNYTLNVIGNNYMNDHVLNYDLSLPITTEQMLQKAKTAERINPIFRTYKKIPVTKGVSQLTSLLLENKYTEILKLIKE